MTKKRELARLRAALEEAAELHDEAAELLGRTAAAMEELRGALDRSIEELRAARAAWETAAPEPTAGVAS